MDDLVLDRVRRSLEFIIKNDKTVYTYAGRNRKNRNGEEPDLGRWTTPREIAEDELRRLGRPG